MKKKRLYDLVDKDIEKYRVFSAMCDAKRKVQKIKLDLSEKNYYAAFSNKTALDKEVYTSIEDSYESYVTDDTQFKLDINFSEDTPQEEQNTANYRERRKFKELYMMARDYHREIKE